MKCKHAAYYFEQHPIYNTEFYAIERQKIEPTMFLMVQFSYWASVTCNNIHWCIVCNTRLLPHVFRVYFFLSQFLFLLITSFFFLLPCNSLPSPIKYDTLCFRALAVDVVCHVFACFFHSLALFFSFSYHIRRIALHIVRYDS